MVTNCWLQRCPNFIWGCRRHWGFIPLLYRDCIYYTLAGTRTDSIRTHLDIKGYTAAIIDTAGTRKLIISPFYPQYILIYTPINGWRHTPDLGYPFGTRRLLVKKSSPEEGLGMRPSGIPNIAVTETCHIVIVHLGNS